MSVSPYHACECTHEFTTWLTTRSFPSTAAPGHRLLIPSYLLLAARFDYSGLDKFCSTLELCLSLLPLSSLSRGTRRHAMRKFRGLQEGLGKATSCELVYCFLYPA
jgi:hypothetical protein